MSEKNANHTHPPYRKYETTAAYNLPDSKPESRQGQMVCVDGGHLKRCEENLNAPVPVRRYFGTFRFSTSFQPPAVHAYHLPLEAFVRRPP